MALRHCQCKVHVQQLDSRFGVIIRAQQLLLFSSSFDGRTTPLPLSTQLLLSKHRQDMGISSLATFEPDFFVVRGSNAKEGGGAVEVRCFFFVHDETSTQ